MARAGLLQPHVLPLSFGTDHHRLQVQEVAVVALRVEGLQVDHPFALLDGHLGVEIRRVQSAQAPLPNLRPELPVLLPTQPVSGPTWAWRREVKATARPRPYCQCASSGSPLSVTQRCFRARLWGVAT